MLEQGESKRILVTQRMQFDETYNEIRDSLDHSWYGFFEHLNMIPILIPNDINIVKKIILQDDVTYDGLLLTGGGDFGKSSHARDEVENLLIANTINLNIPILGVCRGMEQLLLYFEHELVNIKGHVNTRHTLKNIKGKLSKLIQSFESVNSFHKLGVINTNHMFQITSMSDDDVVMSIEYKNGPIFGQMWHPEREKEISRYDIEIFKRIFSI
jgi:gamma-glutamyl-gamma-aminobutyrate hydrolase PuuD